MTAPQAANSVAAGTGGASGYPHATNPNYAVNSAASYPATSRNYASPYGTQPAAAFQSPTAGGQVQPTVGYQTGPYGMTSSSAAPSAAGASGYPAASGASWNTPGAATAASGPASPYGTNGYQTADQRSAYGGAATGAAASSPYGQAAAGASPYAGSAGYAAPSYGTSASPYGAAGAAAPAAPTTPSAATGPWSGYSQPATPYNQSGSTQPTGTTSPAASTASTSPASGYGTASPAAATTASNYPAVPSSLTADSSTYHPGSTAGGYGVQNANYSQPQTATSGAYNPGGATNYGNSYTR